MLSKRIIAVLTATLLLGVFEGALSQQDHLVFEAIDPALANYGSVKWEARWDRNVIGVCWISPKPDDEEGRTWVREAVAETWEMHSGVRLVGWQPCASTFQGIKILVDDSNPRS